MSEQAFYLVLFAVTAILGYRGSFRLTRRFRLAAGGSTDRMTYNERLLLGSIVVVAWVVTIAATYLGVLSIRRVLGFESVAFLAPVSILVAMGVLLIPAGLDLVIERIARLPEDDRRE